MKPLLKRVMTAGLLLAFAGAPSLARAATIDTTPAVAETTGAPPLGSTRPGAATGEAANYAAREAAVPQLQNFKGGSVVVFIGGGTLVIVLIIVLIILVV